MRRVIPLLAILIAGCAAQATPADKLAPSEWRFTSIDGKAPASDQAKLTLDDEKLGANLGCNSMGGPWRIEKDRLIAGPAHAVATQVGPEPFVVERQLRLV